MAVNQESESVHGQRTAKSARNFSLLKRGALALGIAAPVLWGAISCDDTQDPTTGDLPPQAAREGGNLQIAQPTAAESAVRDIGSSENAIPREPVVGQLAPNFEVKDKDDKIVSFSELTAGKAAFLDICGHMCREEIWDMNKIFDEIGQDNILYLPMVQMPEEADMLGKQFPDLYFLKDNPFGQEQVSDIYGLDGLNGLPCRVFIDRYGFIVKIYYGRTGIEELRSDLELAIQP